MAYGDLTTLADVKAWLQTGQNPFPATEDALLQRLIAGASEFIQNWLGRPIASGDWLETRDGTGGQLLAFANIPVTAVLSLTIDGLAIPPAPADGQCRRRLHLYADRIGLARLCLHATAAEHHRHLHRRVHGNAGRYRAGLHRARCAALP